MKIKVSTFCNHQWKAVPAIGVRKYMCTQCGMFGFKVKDASLNRVHEHSIEVSDYLLDQYIELVHSTGGHVEAERLGPKPGLFRMREYDNCEHYWVPAPEYSDNHRTRLKCTKCERVGKRRATGEVVAFVKEYTERLRRYMIRKQHLEAEPVCEHEWKLLPLLGTKFVNRYECKRCKWLGYRVGNRVPIKVHTALSTDRIRMENGLKRKEADIATKEPATSQQQENCKSEKVLQDVEDSVQTSGGTF